jgi:hypothetical protein
MRDYFNWPGTEMPDGSVLTTEEPMRCGDCDRPTYWEEADWTYHHAVDTDRGCFLIGAEPDRLEDSRHPLHPHPGRFSMDEVVRLLRERHGVKARVEDTGGGCATIYAGGLTLAGPGWFEGSSGRVQPAAFGSCRSFGDVAEFYVGPDDDGVSEPVSFGVSDREVEIAAAIAAQVLQEV